MKLKISSILQNQYATFLKLKAITIVLLFVFLSFSAFSIDKPTFRVIINPDSPNPTECTFRLNPGEDTGNYNNVQLWPIGTNGSKWRASYSTTGGFFFDCYYVEFSSIDITSSKTYNSTDVPFPFNYIYHGHPVKIVASNIPGPPSITSPSTVVLPPGESLDYEIKASSLFDLTYNTPTNLPTGLIYDAATHKVTGPLANGIHTFTASVKNAAGTTTELITIKVGTPPNITSSSSVSLSSGADLNYTITATGSTPLDYNATNLSPGLSYNDSTHITGLNLTTGTYTFRAYASNFVGTVFKDVTVTVGVPPSLGPDQTVIVNKGGTFSYSISASGSDLSYSISGKNPSSTPLEINAGQVTITNEVPYADTHDKVIIFTINASNGLGVDSQKITIKYIGGDISLFGDTNGVNPQGFLITSDNLSEVTFSTSKDFLSTFYDSSFNDLFAWRSGVNPPETLYLKAQAPVIDATATITRNGSVSSVFFSVIMDNPDITGSLFGGIPVSEEDEDDPNKLVSNSGAVIELAMDRKLISAGNVHLSFSNPNICKLYYDSNCKDPVGSTALYSRVYKFGTFSKMQVALQYGSLFLKPLYPVEECIATYTYTNSSGYTSTDKVHFKINMTGIGITGYTDLNGTTAATELDGDPLTEHDPTEYQVNGAFKIVLSKGNLGIGTVTLKLNNGSLVPAKFYTNSSLASNTELTSTSVDLANPSGGLAALAQGNMTLYVKPLVPMDSLNIVLEHSYNGTVTSDKLTPKVNMTGIGITGYTDVAGTTAATELDGDPLTEHDPTEYQVNGAFKIVLSKGNLGIGTVTLKLNNGSLVPAKFYTNSSLASNTELTSTSVDLANPSGGLAALAQGNMTLYVKPLVPMDSLNIVLEHSYNGTVTSDKLTPKVNMTGIGITGYTDVAGTTAATELDGDPLTEHDPTEYQVNGAFKIVLSKNNLESGTVSLKLNNGTPVPAIPAKFYTSLNPLTELSSTSVDLASPSGGLAELAQNGSMTLYVKPLVPLYNLNIELEHSYNGTVTSDKLEVKVNMSGIGITGYTDLTGTTAATEDEADALTEHDPAEYQVGGPFKIVLSKGDLLAGTLTLSLTDGSPVPAKFYTNSNLEPSTELSSTSIDLANPEGGLAELAQNGSMTLYVKPLIPTDSLDIELKHVYIGTTTDKLVPKVNMTGIGITGYTDLAGTTAATEDEADALTEHDPAEYTVSHPFKIVLSKGNLGAGTATLKVSADGAEEATVAKFYTDIALQDEISSMAVDIANASGDLADLAGGSMTLYVRPLVPTSSLNIKLEHSYIDTSSDELKVGIPLGGVNITGYKGTKAIPEEEECPSDLSVPAYDKASVDAGTTPGYVKVKLERGALVSGKIKFAISHETGKDRAVEVYLDENLTKPLKDREVDIGTPTGDLKPLGNGQAGSMFLYIKPIAEASRVTATITYNDGSTSSDKFSFRICSECPCTGCPPGKEGDDSIRDGNINSKLSMGSNSYGKPAGSIYLNSAELSMGMAGPGALQIVPFQGTTVNYTYDPNDSTIVQKIDINTGVTEIEIAFTTATHGTKKYYTSNTMTYRKAGETTPYRTVTISNMYAPVPLGGDDYDFTVNSLNISNALTLSSGTVTTTAKYEKPDANTWKLTRNNSIVEYLNTVTDSSAGTKTETYYIGSMTTPVFKDTNIYKIYPWGDALIQNIGAETTTYEYYDNAGTDGMKLGNLKKVTYPKGDTVEYTYGANGNLLETITTKGGHVYKTTREVFSIARIDVNSIPGTPSICGIDATTGTFDYGTIPDTDTLILLGSKEINKQYCDNTLTSHSESINYYDYSAGVDQYIVYEDATTTRTTTTEYYSDITDFKYGRVKKVVNADGNIALYEYTRSGSLETVTSYSGEPNTGGTAVINGTKNVSVYNPNGTLMSSTSYAIVASALTQTASQTTAAADLDEFGRATKTTYMDGTTVERTYGCCGVDSETDRNGITTTYQYDATSKLMTSSTRNGITTLYTYDQAGNTLTTTVKGRNDTELTNTNVYNEYGVMTSSTDPMNYTTTYTNNGDTVTYPNGTTSITNYTGGVVSGTSGTAVHAMTYTSGPDWQKVMPQDITTYTDMLGRQYKTVYADGKYSETFYNSKGQAVKTVSPGGKITLTEYDAIGRVYRSVIDMDKDGVVNNNDEITQYTYAYGTKNSKTVSVTTVTRIVGSNSKVLSVSESTLDGMESWSTVNGLVTHSVTTRPAAGQLNTTVEYPDGSKTITYTVNGLTTKVESFQLDGTTAGNVVEYTYDEFDRISTITEKFGTTIINEVENTSYNNNGQPLTVTTNGKATTYVYDNMGRRTSVTLPGSRTVTYTYKNTGELATVDGAETYKQSYDYDSQGRMSTLSTYKTPTAPQNTTWAYNNRGFMTSKTYADGNGTTYTYSDDGELATRVWDRGITTTYSYDNAGRQTGVDYSDTTPDITYTYDWMGNPATVTDAEGTRTFTYNYTTSGHPGLASVTVPGIVGSIDYTYDAYGRRTAMSLMKNSSAVLTNNYGYDTTSGKLNKIDDGTYSANYTYADGTGLITQNQIKLESTSAVVTTHNRTYDTRLNNYHLLNTSNTTGATTRTYSYLYNDKDQRTKLTLPDGSYWEYSYDDKGQVTGGVKKNAAGNLIAGQYFGYSYDGIGNRLYAETKLSELKLTYSTNNVNQYTQINTPGIVPVLGEADADTTVQAVRTDASNLTGGKQKTVPTRSGKYFSGAFTGIDNSTTAQTIPYDVYAIKDETTTQQIQKASSSYTVPKAVTSPTYDTDGNMTSDGEWTYTYNGENRPITVINADNTKKFEYKYDYMGRRIEEKYYTSSGTWTLSKHLKFVYNGFKKIAEYDGSDNLLKVYTWQPVDLDVPLWVKDGSSYYFYIVDGNKNVRSMVDASGNEVASYDYNPFGGIASQSGTYADSNMYRFSSEYYNPILKSSDYGLRDYSFVLGRWRTRDPLGEQGGVNRYGFVKNDAINKWDYLGMIPFPSYLETSLKNLIKSWEEAQSDPAKAQKAAEAMQFALRAAPGTLGMLNPKFSKRYSDAIEFFQYWLTKNNGKPKYLKPASKFYKDKGVKRMLRKTIRKELTKAIRNKTFNKTIGGMTDLIGPTPNKVHNPENKIRSHNIRYIFGRTHIFYRLKASIAGKKICTAYFSWWVDDPYEFNKEFLGVGNVKFPEKIFTDLKDRGLANTFNARVLFYSKHDVKDRTARKLRIKSKYSGNPWGGKTWNLSPKPPENILGGTK